MNQSKLENIGVGKDHARCHAKLEKNSFNNILALKIIGVFEFNRTNISSADTNLDTFRFY